MAASKHRRSPYGFIAINARLQVTLPGKEMSHPSGQSMAINGTTQHSFVLFRRAA
jgi:pectin methylesterase-like acyl-CoA thioesterase